MGTLSASVDKFLATLPHLPSSSSLPFDAAALMEKLPFNLAMVVEKLPSWPISALALVFSYSLLCRSLRFRRVKQQREKFGFKTRESFAKMTANEANAIGKYIFELEFPFTSEKAAQFALFRYVSVDACEYFHSVFKTLVDQTQSDHPLSFAALTFLYRTYGIPTISKTLCETKQLSEPVFASRVRVASLLSSSSLFEI